MVTLSVLISGLGLATDLYDYSIINTVRPVLESEFGPMTESTNGLVTMATFCGAICGQLFLGRLGDAVGRRSVFLGTAVLTIIGSIGCACVHHSSGWRPYDQLMLWRFVLGVGIGGEYPLSAANTAENASAATSGTQLAMAALCFLGGQLLAPLLILAANAACGDRADRSMIFRAGFSGGIVLGAISLVLRWSRMKETKKFQDHCESRSNSRPAVKDMWILKRPLLGTTLHWFLYDVVSCGTGLYTTTILESVTFTGTLANVLVVTLLSVPGYLLTLKVQAFGRRRAQLVGFGGMAICFVCIVAIDPPKWLFVLLFGLQKSFDAFGPGFTTYLIPAEIFPTRLRGSTHGLSAAFGKLGAVVGTYAFPSLVHATGVKTILLGCAALSCIGCMTTLFLTPSYGEAELEVLDLVSPEEAADVLFGKGRFATELRSMDEFGVSLADAS